VLDLFSKIRKSYFSAFKSTNLLLFPPGAMIGDNFFFLNSVDSTNNYAMGRVYAQLAKHGDVYLAREQTAGKGQRGKEWRTAAGENITVSVVLDTKTLLFSSQFLLSAGVALAACDLITEKVKNGVKIKWPNDIYWCDRKAGGILIENVLQGVEWKFAVAGIGLNINQAAFPAELPNPVSLKQITGRQWNIEDLTRELAACLERRWQQLATGRGDQLLEEYNDILYRKTERVKLKKQAVVFETVIKEVNKAGELITEDALTQRFNSGDVQWVI
jgi:BirA family transcriptional regulator, biotin operon repressor / biotin---[acetyl-CoA-carboxylase] ligase